MADSKEIANWALALSLLSVDTFRGESTFKTWLLRIVTNRALDFLRARKVRLAVSLEGDDEGGLDLPAPDDADAAAAVHKDFRAKLKYARIWGSGKHDGVMAKRDHILQDGDIIELHM